jgi:hypothetical protein
MLPVLMAEAGHPVQSGDLVTLPEGGKVKDRAEEIIEFAAEREHRSTDVDQFAGAFPDDMDAEHYAGFGVKQQLEHPDVVADYLSRAISR